MQTQWQICVDNQNNANSLEYYKIHFFPWQNANSVTGCAQYIYINNNCFLVCWAHTQRKHKTRQNQKTNSLLATLEKCKLKITSSSLKSLKTSQSDKYASCAGQNFLAEHPVRCYFCLVSFRWFCPVHEQAKISIHFFEMQKFMNTRI